MALSDAIKEVAEDMLTEANAYGDSGISPGLVRNWAKQLLRICKAAESISSSNREVDHQAMIDKARQEFRNGLPKRDAVPNHVSTTEENAMGGTMLEIADGPACVEGAANFVEGNANMPAGARMFVAGAVYQKHVNGKLYYDKDASEKMKGIQASGS